MASTEDFLPHREILLIGITTQVFFCKHKCIDKVYFWLINEQKTALASQGALSGQFYSQLMQLWWAWRQCIYVESCKYGAVSPRSPCLRSEVWTCYAKSCYSVVVWCFIKYGVAYNCAIKYVTFVGLSRPLGRFFVHRAILWMCCNVLLGVLVYVFTLVEMITVKFGFVCLHRPNQRPTFFFSFWSQNCYWKACGAALCSQDPVCHR